MAQRLNISRGEIWTHQFRRPDKTRPVLILSRPEAIRALHTVMVAPITSTLRGLPSEVVLGVAEGLKHESAANMDHLQTVEKQSLSRYVGQLGTAKMHAVCRALGVATGCD